ncbi:MAG: diguanylate cyclase (GGDEF)-like protein [Halioglobus sp.]|jgi:diguanylate cyclase (GGDEF)-like protein
MYTLKALFRQFRNWLVYLCTGRAEYASLEEEFYRQRILVMTSCFWLLTVLALTVITPFALELSPEGKVAADVLFLTTGFSVLLSMLVLRFFGNRMMALNILLTIWAGAFAASCLIFGGTQSPTYHLLMLAPAMAGIAGSIYLSITWGAIVLAVWTSILMMERSGFEFLQIIVPQNHSMAMMLSYAAMATAVVSIIIIYAEMNKNLRNSLQDSNTELEHLSSHDQLTRLPNRRFYDERIGHALQRAADQKGLMGLLMLDLNHFKKINDTHGHGAGDKLLITVAQRIEQNLRETDLVARLGGDEFAIVLEDVNSAEEVTRIAHKLSQAIEQPLSVRQHQLHFSASIGVALFPLDGRQQQELEEKADKAMYLAKKRGIPVALSSLEAANIPTPVRDRPRQL